MVAVGKKKNGMIDKTIICLSARANSGKTTSIRELFFRLIGHYPESTGDFLSIVQDKNVEHGIGISSVGDSWGNREPIEKLIDAGCEIIVCASRTSKDTVNTVYELASNYQYKVVQISALHGEHNDTIENYNLNYFPNRVSAIFHFSLFTFHLLICCLVVLLFGCFVVGWLPG